MPCLEATAAVAMEDGAKPLTILLRVECVVGCALQQAAEDHLLICAPTSITAQAALPANTFFGTSFEKGRPNTTASINWKQNKTRKFYGHSYTAPTPKEFTLQQIGLSVTKAFALHLRNSTRKMNSTHGVVAQPPPPGLEQFDLDEISVDTTA